VDSAKSARAGPFVSGLVRVVAHARPAPCSSAFALGSCSGLSCCSRRCRVPCRVRRPRRRTRPEPRRAASEAPRRRPSMHVLRVSLRSATAWSDHWFLVPATNWALCGPPHQWRGSGGGDASGDAMLRVPRGSMSTPGVRHRQSSAPVAGAGGVRSRHPAPQIPWVCRLTQRERALRSRR